MIGDLAAWLALPLDVTRPHAVSQAIAWHGRLMVLAWGILLPVGVLIARFCKVLPNQNWPKEVDNRFWWHSHLGLQYTGGVLMLAGAYLAIRSGLTPARHIHGLLGYSVLILGIMQFIAGWLRGSKGGPTEPDIRGDHYDMTVRRHIFEHFHKTAGYLAIGLAMATIISGLTMANAPRWMAPVLLVWWITIICLWIILQRKGRAIDTYQAIWGQDIAHPGNRSKSVGWGMSRPASNRFENRSGNEN